MAVHVELVETINSIDVARLSPLAQQGFLVIRQVVEDGKRLKEIAAEKGWSRRQIERAVKQLRAELVEKELLAA